MPSVGAITVTCCGLGWRHLRTLELTNRWSWFRCFLGGMVRSSSPIESLSALVWGSWNPSGSVWERYSVPPLSPFFSRRYCHPLSFSHPLSDLALFILVLPASDLSLRPFHPPFMVLCLLHQSLSSHFCSSIFGLTFGPRFDSHSFHMYLSIAALFVRTRVRFRLRQCVYSLSPFSLAVCRIWRARVVCYGFGPKALAP